MKSLRILLPLLALAAMTCQTFAGHRGHCHCPSCGGVCRPVPEKVVEKKSCFNVEREQICIPAITFPWECPCKPPRCGKVITVNVLKKHSYECESCGYRWDIQSPCKRGGGPCQQPALEPPLPPPPPPPPPPVFTSSAAASKTKQLLLDIRIAPPLAVTPAPLGGKAKQAQAPEATSQRR